MWAISGCACFFQKNQWEQGNLEKKKKVNKKIVEKDFRVCGRFDKWDYNWTKKSWEQGIFIFFIKKIFFLKKGPKRRILGGASFGDFSIFWKKKCRWGGCIFAFWNKVAVRKGTFGWKFCWILVGILKKMVYYRREWRKPPRGQMFSGGGFLTNNPIIY